MCPYSLREVWDILTNLQAIQFQVLICKIGPNSLSTFQNLLLDRRCPRKCTKRFMAISARLLVQHQCPAVVRQNFVTIFQIARFQLPVKVLDLDRLVRRGQGNLAECYPTIKDVEKRRCHNGLCQLSELYAKH